MGGVYIPVYYSDCNNIKHYGWPVFECGYVMCWVLGGLSVKLITVH